MKACAFLLFALVGSSLAWDWSSLFQSAQTAAQENVSNLKNAVESGKKIAEAKAGEISEKVKESIAAGTERHNAAIEKLKEQLENSGLSVDQIQAAVQAKLADASVDIDAIKSKAEAAISNLKDAVPEKIEELKNQVKNLTG